jgi:hypothetical protein
MEEESRHRRGRRRIPLHPVAIAMLIAAVAALVAAVLAALALQGGNSFSPNATAPNPGPSASATPLPTGPRTDLEVNPVGANPDWAYSTTSATDVCANWIVSSIFDTGHFSPVGAGN